MDAPLRERRPCQLQASWISDCMTSFLQSESCVLKGGVLSNILLEVSLNAITIFGAGGRGGGFLAHTSFEAYP